MTTLSIQETIMIDMQAEIDALKAKLAIAYTDAAYGCLTRAGATECITLTGSEDVIFLDIDNMHALNAEYGYAGVDGCIRESLAALRQHDISIARWYSGDEVILVVPSGDGTGTARRLRDVMRSNGLSATFGVVCASCDLVESVTRAADKVQLAKANGERGTIN